MINSGLIQASVDQLKDEIFATFRIDKRNQELFFKENRIIGYDTLEEANIKHNDTIILVILIFIFVFDLKSYPTNCILSMSLLSTFTVRINL